MIDSNQSNYDLPYRARIMMSASADNQKSTCAILSTKLNSINVLQNLKPMNAKSKPNINYAYSSGDLQPLQWLQQETILSIAPLDNEEEFVPGKDDITSVTTSPVKVDVISESQSDDLVSHNSTIADYYRYQAMRTAMANGYSNGAGSVYRQQGYLSYSTNPVLTNGGVRISNSSNTNSHGLCHTVNEYQKPPFSYTHIIFMAIETSLNKAMTVNDIYVWCETHFPYYTQAGVGWKNSLRHNLSINKSFRKISRDGRGGPGRGAYWVVEPRERNNLIDAIRRSPCSLGSFPFLGNSYPWVNGNCYSNNIFQSANTLNNSLSSLSTAHSVVNNKLNSNTDLRSGSRGPLLRIGGQLTDASNFIRSTPVIQRLNDSSSIIDLTKGSQILPNSITLSNNPLIHFDQIKFESEVSALNESTDSNDVFSSQMDQDDCRGKVFIVEDPVETNPEFYQTYLEILKGLMYNDMEKSNSSRSESTKDYPENLKIKKSSHQKNSGKITGTNEDNAPSEAIYESYESESSISNKEFSELSDTDFNWRINMGLKNKRKEKKNSFLTKLKSLSTKRKSSHTRNRINNIIRAPHLDHVYAVMQEFLTPANTSSNQSPCNQNIDDKESFSSTFADDKSILIDISQSALSKRSKHKLQFQKRSLKEIHYSDSDGEYFSTTNYENISKKLIRNMRNQRKSNKNLQLSSKSIKNNSRPLKENSDFINKKMYQECNYDDNDDDEERENRYYEKNDRNEDISLMNRFQKSIKNEKYDDSLEIISINKNHNKSNNYDCNINPFKRIRLNKDSNIKRKVGRPKKSESSSVNQRLSKDYQISKEKLSTNKFKRKLKSSKREYKYLKECNSNKKINHEISNKDEQTAINILVNLQRKNQQERIKNMYNLSNFIDRNNSDSNMS